MALTPLMEEIVTDQGKSIDTDPIDSSQMTPTLLVRSLLRRLDWFVRRISIRFSNSTRRQILANL